MAPFSVHHRFPSGRQGSLNPSKAWTNNASRRLSGVVDRKMRSRLVFWDISSGRERVDRKLSFCKNSMYD